MKRRPTNRKKCCSWGKKPREQLIRKKWQPERQTVASTKGEKGGSRRREGRFRCLKEGGEKEQVQEKEARRKGKDKKRLKRGGGKIEGLLCRGGEKRLSLSRRGNPPRTARRGGSSKTEATSFTKSCASHFGRENESVTGQKNEGDWGGGKRTSSNQGTVVALVSTDPLGRTNWGEQT